MERTADVAAGDRMRWRIDDTGRATMQDVVPRGSLPRRFPPRRFPPRRFLPRGPLPRRFLPLRARSALNWDSDEVNR